MSNSYRVISEKSWTVFFGSLLILSSLILVSALIIDNMLGYDPCILCLYERIPFLVIAIICLTSFIVNPSKRTVILQLICLSAIIGAGIAIFHVGVEREWWSPTSKCTTNLEFNQSTSLEEFKKQLEAAPMGDCTKAAFKIFSLSLAEINVTINLLLIAILAQLIKLNAKTKIRKK